MNVLLTGGLGYIGSHIAVALCQAGHTPFIYDNLSNSNSTTLNSIEEITGKKIDLCVGDVRETENLLAYMKRSEVQAIIHLAALKSVRKSFLDPLAYFDNNVGGTISVLKAVKNVGCKFIVYSSSATVYGNPKMVPISESCPTTSPTNPYGQTKLICENFLEAVRSQEQLKIATLRYFNPVGCHDSALLGELPSDDPENLCPAIVAVAKGLKPYLRIFGNDYPTPDGTAIRDYIHVVDLAEAHVKALEKIRELDKSFVLNLGVGRGHSVLEVVSAFEDVNRIKIPYAFEDRRLGDVPVSFADPLRAKEVLEWVPSRSLSDMLRTHWTASSR